MVDTLEKIDLSTLIGEEQIKKIDEKTAKRYKVVEETIDLEKLKIEKKLLKNQLKTPKPTTKKE